MNPTILFVLLPRLLNRLAGDRHAWRDALAAVETIEGAVRHGRLDPAKRVEYFDKALTHILPPDTKNRTRIINFLREAAVTFNDLRESRSR